MSCRLDVAPPRATLTLARPPLHVLNLEGIGDLQRALESLPEIESLYREELASTEDMLEGLNAFLEKRKPVWRGR